VLDDDRAALCARAERPDPLAQLHWSSAVAEPETDEAIHDANSTRAQDRNPLARIPVARRIALLLRSAKIPEGARFAAATLAFKSSLYVRRGPRYRTKRGSR
jgi:hypothetical protein